MDRKAIKEEAKKRVKGNKWNILWPSLLIGVAISAIDYILKAIFGVSATTEITTNLPIGYSLCSSILSIITVIFEAGYLVYVLKFVRTGKAEFSDITKTVKEKWIDILVASVLVGLIVFACSLLFVVPGIIMALAYSFVLYLVVDKGLKGKEALKKSRAMMKGYKWNYFVFGLSFIGWVLLVPFTLGILLIWLIPYITIASALYYEELCKVNG